ncbi:FRG domain-containing protein [Ruminococcus sp.]|uniref:FRG domain-containing protein n=1 Tax=Ruminococcus sp. TaxID=41978 RepID=UPI0025F87F16|nr:FRG domain-containing protein [Ruminococcus sp.]MBR1432573.1 FRG domain-containing protein [Ruminococcus sp.]
MTEKDNLCITFLKDTVRKLQQCSTEDSQSSISEERYKELIFNESDIPEYDSEEIKDYIDQILIYDNANTDDKLRAIYERLDQIQAKYNASIEIPDTVEDIEEHRADKYIDSFITKGIDKEDITVVNSLTEFIAFIHDLDLGYLSRGQENSDWPLLPSALRTEKGERIYSKDDIKSMVDEFRKSLSYYDKSYDHSKNSLEVMAYAQHFAIPTNLIDFTESHIISLLFALENYSSTNCAIVYFVDALKFNQAKCGKNTIPNCSEDEKDCDGGASSIFIKSDNVNERIHFQRGYFLKVPENYDKSDVIEELKSFCKIVLIPYESKMEVLCDLFKLGLGFQSIYPDLDNMAKSIKFKNKMNREAL